MIQLSLNGNNLQEHLPLYIQSAIAKMSKNSSKASTCNGQNDEQPQTHAMDQFKNIGPSVTNMNIHFNISDNATDEGLNFSGTQSVN